MDLRYPAIVNSVVSRHHLHYLESVIIVVNIKNFKRIHIMFTTYLLELL